MWDILKEFEGKTFYTLDRKIEFVVDEIEKNSIKCTVVNRKRSFSISVDQFEAAYKEIKTRGNVRCEDFRYSIVKLKSGTTSYLCALLVELPDIDFTIRPITLHSIR